MLQRIQSLYLLLAIAAVVFSVFVEWVTYTTPTLTLSFLEGSNALIMQVIAALSVLTLIVVIFRYNDRKQQMTLANIAMLDMLLILGAFSYLHYSQIQSLKETGELSMEYGLAPALPIIGLILIWMAKKAIKKDEDLVKSVDRLR